MQLSPQQIEYLRRIAPGEDGQQWRGILESYILELKDDCVLGDDLSKEAARAAIGKLRELVDKLAQLAGQQGISTEKNKHL